MVSIYIVEKSRSARQSAVKGIRDDPMPRNVGMQPIRHKIVAIPACCIFKICTGNSLTGSQLTDFLIEFIDIRVSPGVLAEVRGQCRDYRNRSIRFCLLNHGTEVINSPIRRIITNINCTIKNNQIFGIISIKDVVNNGNAIRTLNPAYALIHDGLSPSSREYGNITIVMIIESK